MSAEKHHHNQNERFQPAEESRGAQLNEQMWLMPGKQFMDMAFIIQSRLLIIAYTCFISRNKMHFKKP